MGSPTMVVCPPVPPSLCAPLTQGPTPMGAPPTILASYGPSPIGTPTVAAASLCHPSMGAALIQDHPPMVSLIWATTSHVPPLMSAP